MAAGVYIIAAKRTAFGTFGGSLSRFSATDLGVIASNAVFQQLPSVKSLVDAVVFGNVLQTSSDAAYLARHIGMRAGVGIDSASSSSSNNQSAAVVGCPALQVNRLCGSGFEAVIQAGHLIRSGECDLVLAGGTESMSQAPFVCRDLRFGSIPYGKEPKLEDMLFQALQDRLDPSAPVPMAETAERLGERYAISRQQCDEFALRSQQRWRKAEMSGVFESEICAVDDEALLKANIPLPSRRRRGANVAQDSFKTDEHARPQTQLENLTKLKPLFRKDGLVTAGNASGINDGASALLVASERFVKQHSIEPLARVVGHCTAAVKPDLMGIGPVPAIRGLLERTQVSLGELDLVEVNEAFAAQVLSVQKELGLGEGFNENGGAIAIGHPLAASGARLLTHLSWQLAGSSRRYALGSACIGGGQGTAVLLENCRRGG